MAGLLDIIPAFKTIPLRGKDVEIKGISIDDIPYLIGRFLILRQLAAEGKFSFEELIKRAPDALAALFACGTGERGNAKAEMNARQLVIGDQLDLFTAILEVSVPGGLGPFGAQLSALGLFLPRATETTISPSVKTDPSPSETPSPPPSTNSSAAATTAETSSP
jgi:hypothetical protein